MSERVGGYVRKSKQLVSRASEHEECWIRPLFALLDPFLLEINSLKKCVVLDII